MFKRTDFKASSACILVVESEERVLAMQSLKSIASSLLRQASAKTIFSVIQPLRCKANRRTHTDDFSLKLDGVPYGAEVYRANQYDLREVPADAVFPVRLMYTPCSAR
jgi:hypothetical protein